MANKDLLEARERAAAFEAELQKVYDDCGSDKDLMKSTTLTGDIDQRRAHLSEKVDAFRAANKALIELENIDSGRRELEKARLDREAAQARSDGKLDTSTKELVYHKFAASPEAQQKLVETGNLPRYSGDVSMKTLFQTDAGWAPESVRSGRFVPQIATPIEVIDLFPNIPTDQEMYVYMEETTRTNAAAETAESRGGSATTVAAGYYQESALAVTQRESPIRKIGTSIPVTKEQLADVAGIRAYLDGRLRLFVLERLDNQLLNGDGSGTLNLRGLLHTTGVGSTAKAGDTPQADAVFDMMRRVRVTGRANPTAILMNPSDWQLIVLAKGTDGHYISNRAIVDPVEERIWGVPVVQASNLAAGTCVVGDFANQCAMLDRQQVELETTDSHDDEFLRDIFRIKVSMRVGVVFFRPQAFQRSTNFSATS